MRIVSTLVAAILIAACNHSDNETVITIIDIGKNNRIGIGKQLRIVNSFSPKLIALDFFLVHDSLSRDSIIVDQLNKLTNVVSVVGLRDLNEDQKYWSTLERSHSKFKVSGEGFANLAADDLVLDNQLPIWDVYRRDKIYSFGYIVALNSFGLKSKYRNADEMDKSFDFDRAPKNYITISNKDFGSANFKRENIEGKIVLMGYLGNDEDYFYLSFFDKNRNKRLNGVEVHALIINELIEK